MDSVKVIIDGIEKNVDGLFYIFDSKYYFVYTAKEVDENNYVILYMMQVGKETINTETGVVDTGYMIGVEITDPVEQEKAQMSISYIVNDKKNNTVNPQIQYLPITMLSNLKIVSKKRFRLLKSIITDNFKLDLDISQDNNVNISTNGVDSIESQVQIPQPVQVLASKEQIAQPIIETVPLSQKSENITITNNEILENNSTIIIDYRTKYFELEEKNQELQNQIDMLTQKLNEIKKVIE